MKRSSFQRMGGMLLVLSLVGGCSSPARFVYKDATGGVIAIPDNSNTWPNNNRDAAERLMKEHLPDAVIVAEQEVKVGEDIVNNQRTDSRPLNGVLFGETTTSTNSTVKVDRKEYRIEYRSKAAAGGANSIGSNTVSPVSDKRLIGTVEQKVQPAGGIPAASTSLPTNPTK